MLNVPETASPRAEPPSRYFMHEPAVLVSARGGRGGLDFRILPMPASPVEDSIKVHTLAIDSAISGLGS